MAQRSWPPPASGRSRSTGALRHFTAVVLASVAATTGRAVSEATPTTAVPLDLRAFRPVEGPSSGPAVYYRVLDAPEGTVLEGSYEPGMHSVTMGVELPPELRRGVRRVRWSWRARVVPAEGDECRAHHGDSAASVSLAFRRGTRWYILKYVWSGVSPLGAVCDRKRSPFLARDTIVLERGPPRDTWLREVVDVRRAFLEHFAGGEPGEDVPELVGIGVMTDGDQTSTEAGAEWTGFELLY